MAIQEEVLDAIRQMSVADLLDLVRALAIELESPDGHGLTNAGSATEPVEVVQRDTVAVSLREFGADRVEIIRAVREITDLGLRESRALVDASPAQVAYWDPDADPGTSTDADGPEAAGAPAKPRTPPPTGAGSEQLPIPRRPRRAA